MILAAFWWNLRIHQMFERFRRWKIVRLGFDVWPYFTVQLPTLSILVLPVVIGFIRFRSLRVFSDWRFSWSVKHELNLLKLRLGTVWIFLRR